MAESTKIAIFKGKTVRRVIYRNEWWFVVTDVILALTDSVQPEGYIKDMRRRDPELSKGWGQIVTPLRTRMLYKLKGYPDSWIEKRMRGIFIREELTDEWQKRGAKQDKDYEILTAEISKATFGVTPSQYIGKTS